jgi:peptide/nickel transport system permease protein
MSLLHRGRRAVHTLTGGTIAGSIALGVVLLVLFVVVFGPYLAPYTPSQIVGVPFQARSSKHLFGTDFLGRDVLSRVLNGGRTSVALAAASTIGSYVIGATIGLLAGYREGRLDAALMRGVDVLLAFPPILFLLVLAAGAGPSAWVLVVAITIVFAPSVARVIRSATQTVSHSGYVEAAVARGESTSRIIFREILPNIRPAVVADAGPRLTFAILLVAAVNYLGLGLRPPAADWALMISENRAGLNLQPWALTVPALLIAVLTVAVNVVADQQRTIAATSDESGVVA